MKKIKIEFSFILLVLICLIFNKFVYLFNYLFALILHELAHLYVANKKGYSLQTFRIKMTGLVIELDKNVDEKDSFAINLAGPLFNIILAICCMAIYWIIPTSYMYLNVFCNTNLVLALFNLLPIWPLDGGKIFAGFFKKEKTFKIVDLILRICFALLFFVLFIISLFNDINYFLLLFSLFFVVGKNKKSPTFSLFKYKNSMVEKVEIFKVDSKLTIYNLIKLIKKNRYSIFYLAKFNKYINEDEMIDFALNYPLTTKIEDVVN